MDNKRRRPRTCAGCGEEHPKRGLLRIARSPDGTVQYDPTGKAPGRGAYICANKACLDAAKKKNAIGRMLKVAVPASVYDYLEKECGVLDEKP